MWTITKDYVGKPSARPRTNLNAVGVVGPGTATLSHEQIVGHPQGRRFRLLDDDGELYYEGVWVGDDSSDELQPLDNFGTPNAGATTIEYLEADGRWWAA